MVTKPMLINIFRLVKLILIAYHFFLGNLGMLGMIGPTIILLTCALSLSTVTVLTFYLFSRLEDSVIAFPLISLRD
jgi:hypothetical protein